MATWQQFLDASPGVGEVFRRRHEATGKLCMLGTLRADGWPRICPVEPRVAAGHLWVGGMPDTRKLADLERDPRFTLHTATVDPFVGEGDAKLWGRVVPLADPEPQREFARVLFDDTGIDLREQVAAGPIEQLWVADIDGAAAVEIVDERLRINVWNPTDGDRLAAEH